jgi:hypothetical protein
MGLGREERDRPRSNSIRSARAMAAGRSCRGSGREEGLWIGGLALISTGDVDNRAPEAWVRHAIPQVERAFDSRGFVERGRDRLNFRA